MKWLLSSDKKRLLERFFVLVFVGALISSDTSLRARTVNELLYGASKTLLHEAAATGDIKMLEVLIASGVDVNIRDRQGQTPLHYASTSEVAKLLLEAGANVNAQNDDFKQTPLHWVAGDSGDVELIEVLLDNRAEIDACTARGATPLLYAVAFSNVPAARLLLDRGASIMAIAHDGFTVLHWAVFLKNIPLVKLLVERKAPLTIVDNDGKTPRDLAQNKELQEIVKILDDAASRYAEE